VKDMVKQKIKFQVMRLLHALFPLQSNKVLFFSFSGSTYSDNPKAISLKLHELYPEVRQVWIFSNPEMKRDLVPFDFQITKKWNLRSIYDLATAKVWVMNDALPYWAYKGKDQIYIQTWHGDRGFKKILYDFSSREGMIPLREDVSCDLAVAGSDFGEAFYRTAFHYTGKVLKTGCPRNDELIHASSEKIIDKKAFLGLGKNFRYILYAPTLRNKQGKTREAQPVQTLDFISILDTLERITGERWRFLVRSHIKVPGLTGFPDSERIINATQIEDMADLLLVSDMLITDYSSSVGDFALTKRPMILFQDDRATYLEKERTFYFDLDSSPFWIVQSQGELLELLEDLPNRDVDENCKDVLNFFKTHETGHASEDVARFIGAHVKIV